MVQLDIDAVLTAMSQKIGELTKDNAILSVLVDQLKRELQSGHEAQVSKKGSGIQNTEAASEAPPGGASFL